MKSEQEMKRQFFTVLAELESGTVEKDSRLYTILITQLELLYDLLGDNIHSDYWPVIDKYL